MRPQAIAKIDACLCFVGWGTREATTGRYLPPSSDRLISPRRKPIPKPQWRNEVAPLHQTPALIMCCFFRLSVFVLSNASRYRPIRTSLFIQDGIPNRSPKDVARTRRCITRTHWSCLINFIFCFLFHLTLVGTVQFGGWFIQGGIPHRLPHHAARRHWIKFDYCSCLVCFIFPFRLRWRQ